MKNINEVIGTPAMQAVAIERQRQINDEGWTPDHDDEHVKNEMAASAACYASPDPIYTYNASYCDGVTGVIRIDGAWPWDSAWWKPSTRRRNLVKAAALIIAEIERLDRKALSLSKVQEGSDV